MVDRPPARVGPLRLELTVPCDLRFRRLLEVMCERMASYVGYPRVEARTVAEAVARATAPAFSESGPRAYAGLCLSFATSDREMEIRVRYVRDDEARRAGQPGAECCTLKRPLPGRSP